MIYNGITYSSILKRYYRPLYFLLKKLAIATSKCHYSQNPLTKKKIFERIKIFGNQFFFFNLKD